MNTHVRLVSDGWIPLDNRLPPVGQWVLLLFDHNEDPVHRVFKRPRFFVSHAWCFAHKLDDGIPRACFNNRETAEYASKLTGDAVKYWRPFPAVPDIPYEDSQE